MDMNNIRPRSKLAKMSWFVRRPRLALSALTCLVAFIFFLRDFYLTANTSTTITSNKATAFKPFLKSPSAIPLVSSCYKATKICGKALPSWQDPPSACQAFRDALQPSKQTKLLLQQVHFQQAMQEECLWKDSMRLETHHKEARTMNVDSNCSVGIVFPRSLVGYCACGVWKTSKTINYSFTGTMTLQRKQSFLMGFANRTDAQVILTDSGRDIRKKTGLYDYPYYDRMMASRFALCPDGDFPWTYRFLEGIMCGAIPIVEPRLKPEEQELGYEYCEAGLPCVYMDNEQKRQEAAKKNWLHFLSHHTLIMELSDPD